MFKFLFACMAIITGCTLSNEQKALESPAYKASFRIIAQDQICWQGIISKLIESGSSETIQGCGSKTFTWDDEDVAKMNFFNVNESFEQDSEISCPAKPISKSKRIPSHNLGIRNRGHSSVEP